MFQSFPKLNWLLASKIIRTFAKCIVTSHSITIFKKYEQNTAGLQSANLSRLTPFIEKNCLSEVALIKQSKRWHALSALVLHPLQHLLQTINVDVTFPGCEQTEQCQLEQFHVRSK